MHHHKLLDEHHACLDRVTAKQLSNAFMSNCQVVAEL